MNILPETSYLSFSAKRLLNPSWIWINKNIGKTVDFSKYEFAIPLSIDENRFFSSESATFLAERYGGVGLESNGGGARCGLLHDVQIKGIGRNGLAGSGTSFWHSYGGESLANSVRESIWSQLLHTILPFGTVRNFGIVSTGSEVPLFSKRVIRSTPRGLTIREFALRPAHFMRAPYFSSHDERRHGMAPDHTRTRNAIARLPEHLFSIDAGFKTMHAGGLSESLHRMFTRFAQQLATAQARRLVHGALNASNICLDGRWVDFGTATAVSDYGKIIVGNGRHDIWNYSRVTSIAADLVLYLKKYGAACSDLNSAELIATFKHTLESRLEYEFVKLCGISEQSLTKISPKHRSDFYNCIIKIISSGNAEPFKLFSPCENSIPNMPKKMGDFHLPTILKRATLAKNAASLSRYLAPTGMEEKLQTEFVESFFNIRDAYLQTSDGLDPSVKRIAMAINANRINADLSFLYRHILDEAISSEVSNCRNLDLFAEETIARGRFLLEEIPAHRYLNLDQKILFCESGRNIFLTRFLKKSLDLKYLPSDFIFNDFDAEIFKDFCE